MAETVGTHGKGIVDKLPHAISNSWFHFLRLGIGILRTNKSNYRCTDRYLYLPFSAFAECCLVQVFQQGPTGKFVEKAVVRYKNETLVVRFGFRFKISPG